MHQFVFKCTSITYSLDSGRFANLPNLSFLISIVGIVKQHSLYGVAVTIKRDKASRRLARGLTLSRNLINGSYWDYSDGGNYCCYIKNKTQSSHFVSQVH